MHRTVKLTAKNGKCPHGFLVRVVKIKSGPSSTEAENILAGKWTYEYVLSDSNAGSAVYGVVVVGATKSSEPKSDGSYDYDYEYTLKQIGHEDDATLSPETVTISAIGEFEEKGSVEVDNRNASSGLTYLKGSVVTLKADPGEKGNPEEGDDKDRFIFSRWVNRANNAVISTSDVNLVKVNGDSPSSEYKILPNDILEYSYTLNNNIDIQGQFFFDPHGALAKSPLSSRSINLRFEKEQKKATVYLGKAGRLLYIQIDGGSKLNFHSAVENKPRFTIDGADAGAGEYEIVYDDDYGSNTFTVKQIFEGENIGFVSHWVVTIKAKPDNAVRGSVTVDGLDASNGRKYFNGSKVVLKATPIGVDANNNPTGGDTGYLFSTWDGDLSGKLAKKTEGSPVKNRVFENYYTLGGHADITGRFVFDSHGALANSALNSRPINLRFESDTKSATVNLNPTTGRVTTIAITGGPTLNYSSAPNRNSVRFKIAGANGGGGVYEVQYNSSYGGNTYTVKQVFDNVVLDLVSSWVVTITAKPENASKGDVTVDGLNASGGRQYFNGSKVRLQRINKGSNLFAGFYIDNTTQRLDFINNSVSDIAPTAILRGHVTVIGMFRSGSMPTPRELGIPYLANDRGAREITSRANHKLTGYATGSTVKLSLKASPNEFPNRFLVMYGGNVLLDTGMHGTKGPSENYKDPTSGGLEWTNKVSKVANGLTYNIDFVKRAGVDTVQVWVLEYEGIDDRNTWTYTWSYELKKR